MKPLTKIAIVAAVQLLVLLSVLGFKQYTLWTGETVLLEVAPLDPRDPFRGDYVTVRYEISRIDTAELLAGDRYPSGGVYVELREGDDGLFHAVAVHEDRERSFDGTVLIKGCVDYGGQSGSLTVDYGIEQIFIPEGSGEQIPFGGDHVVAVKVKVDRFGNPVARGLLVDGQPLKLERQ
jgi:uncharacterized membrane-anchored protein